MAFDCHFDWNLQPSHTSKDGESLLNQIEVHLTNSLNAMTIPALLFQAFLYVSDYKIDKKPNDALECLKSAETKINECKNENGQVGYNIVHHSLSAKVYGDILMNKSKEKSHKRSVVQLSKFKTEESVAFIDSVRAFALSRLGPVKLDESIEYFQSALKICPQNTEWLFGMALVYGRKTELMQGLSPNETERSEQGRNLFEKILEIDPHHELATVFLAEALFQEGKIQEASRRYDQALQIAPENMKVNTRVAKFFRKTKQWSKALELFVKAEQLPHTKSDSMLHHEKARIYVDKYNTEEGNFEDSHERGLLPGETDKESLLRMALSELDRAINLSPNAIFFGLVRARVYADLGQLQDAKDEYNRSLAVKTDKSWGVDVVRLFLDFGRFLEKTEPEDDESAMGYIKQAIEVAVLKCTDRTTKQFFSNIRKDIDDAIISYEEFYLRQISTDEKNFDAYNNLGWLKQILSGVQICFKDPTTTAKEYYEMVYESTVNSTDLLEKECLCECLCGLIECHVEDKHLDMAKQYHDVLKLMNEEMANMKRADLDARGIQLQGKNTSIEEETGEELGSQATNYSSG